MYPGRGLGFSRVEGGRGACNEEGARAAIKVDRGYQVKPEVGREGS